VNPNPNKLIDANVACPDEHDQLCARSAQAVHERNRSLASTVLFSQQPSIPPHTMSLDRNLFTLNVVPNESNPAVQDLVLPSGTVHYLKEREAGPSYRINLFGAPRSSLTCTHWR
jgi:hypothetical protein